MLGSQTAQALRTTFAPKLSCAERLSAAVHGRPVLSSTYFSSIAALLGNAGQINYAASNAALDGLAQLQLLQVCFIEVALPTWLSKMAGDDSRAGNMFQGMRAGMRLAGQLLH